MTQRNEGIVDIAEILAERGKRYGKFEDHARISQAIKERMCESGGWLSLTEDQAEALEMIAHKIARILNGDPSYADNWVDIAGYAKLVADRLDAPKPAPAALAPSQVAQMEEACAASDRLTLPVRGEVG